MFLQIHMMMEAGPAFETFEIIETAGGLSCCHFIQLLWLFQTVRII
jgi:hypothetical protein